jgi:peptide/nickel transport system substrate-binding protein
VDIMSFEGGGIPLNEIDRMKKVPFLTVLDNISGGLPTYLQFNFKKDFLQDVRVRQAMVYAIDRDKILSTIRKGGAIANTMFPQDWTWPKDLNLYKYDPAKAKQLLTDAKWDTNRKVDFIYYYNDSINVDTVTAIQAYLAAVGVQIVPRYQTPAQINQVYADGTFEMGYFATGIGMDPSLGAAVSTCGATIALNYCNKTVDELYSKGLTESDQAKRAPYYQQISKILNDEMFRGWLWYDTRPLAFNNRIPAVADHFKVMKNLIFNNPVYMEQEKWEVK